MDRETGISLYNITIPIFIKQFKNTLAILQKAEEWCKANAKAESDVIQAKLAPDMRDLAFQVRIACLCARNGIMRDGWAWVPSSTALRDETSFAGLRAAIDAELDALAAVRPDEVDGRESVPLAFWSSGKEGEGFSLKFDDSLRFINELNMPNFWFHCTTIYAICRMKGVELGKRDFLAGGGGF